MKRDSVAVTMLVSAGFGLLGIAATVMRLRVATWLLLLCLGCLALAVILQWGGAAWVLNCPACPRLHRKRMQDRKWCGGSTDC